MILQKYSNKIVVEATENGGVELNNLHSSPVVKRFKLGNKGRIIIHLNSGFFKARR